MEDRMINTIIQGETRSYKSIVVDGKQERLHRHLVESAIGEKLGPSEIIHHKDGNKHNNKLSNLQITTRSNHMKIHDIGKNTRFKPKYHINSNRLVELYVNQNLPIWKVAEITKTTYGAVWRAIKKYGVKRETVYCECGEKAKYIKKRMCVKCYQRDYHAKHR
jgi:hypothetical protein